MDLAAAPGLVFDPHTHRYYYKGREVPGVTKVLSVMGISRSSQFYAPADRERGHAVHEICDLIDQQTPGMGQPSSHEDIIRNSAWDPENTDPSLVPYGMAYASFCYVSPFRPVLIEHPIYSRSFILAGRLDRWGHTFDGGPTMLVDIKSGSPDISHRVQAALYAKLLEEDGGKQSDVVGVLYLKNNGTYKLVPVDTNEFLPAGLAAVSLYHFRKNYGLLNEEPTHD